MLDFSDIFLCIFIFTATVTPVVSTGKLQNQLGEMSFFSRCNLLKFTQVESLKTTKTTTRTNKKEVLDEHMNLGPLVSRIGISAGPGFNGVSPKLIKTSFLTSRSIGKQVCNVRGQWLAIVVIRHERSVTPSFWE